MAAARRSTSRGGWTPSEAVVWRWRSTRTAGGLARVGRGPGFAEDGDADLARVGEAFLDLLGDVAGEAHRFEVVDLAGVDDDADFASGLDGEGAADAFEGGGDFLEAAEALDVALDRFAARAGASAGDGVGDLDDDGLDGVEFDFVVVGLDAVGDGFRTS